MQQAIREPRAHGEPDFPCAAYRGEDTGFPWHWHEEFEAVCCLSGAFVLAAGPERLLLAAGEAALIRPGTPHAYLPQKGQTYAECDLVFHPRLLAGGALLQEVLASAERLPAALRLRKAPEIARACALCFKRPPLYQLGVRALAADLFLAAAAPEDGEAPAPPENAREVERSVQSMLSFLRAHFDQPLTLPELARQAHLSVRECERRFRAQLGMTPMQVLQEARLSAAAALLRAPGPASSVTEIALRCGFQSPGYFARCFRARYGLSPRAFRRR